MKKVNRGAENNEMMMRGRGKIDEIKRRKGWKLEGYDEKERKRMGMRRMMKMMGRS